MFREFTTWVSRGIPTVFAVGCVVVIIGEAQTRLPFLTPRLEYQADLELTGLFRPNQRGYLWVANQSMKTPPMTVNADGHRGEETDWSKPVILALGSSEAFGTGVADSEVWTAVLEERLHHASFGYDVANAAGPGMGAYQQDVVLKRLLEKGRAPSVILVRVSIGDRGFAPIPQGRRETIYQASLRKKSIREFSTFVPFLRNKIVAQFPSIKRACRLSVLRRKGESVYHDSGEEGRSMVENCQEYWESMIDRTGSVGCRIVFVIHAPHGYTSSQVLCDALTDLCGQYENASVMRLGPDIFGMDKIPIARRGAYFRERFTLVRDPHANALQHRLTGEAVASWLVREGNIGL